MKFLYTACALFLAAVSARAATPQKIVLGFVGKSQSNAVFQAAYAGAKDAAKELGPKYNADITIDYQTPTEEDAQKQADAVAELSNSGAQGIMVSCSDANTLTAAINKAVNAGVPVMCFDSDAPKSKRFAVYGTDDLTCGKRVMQALAKAMGHKGTIAILAGNQSAPNLQKRVQGVLDELKNDPSMKLLDDGVIYHKETPEQAAEAVKTTQSTHPEIEGWAFIGGWPLFTKNALPWKPGEIKCVSVDALPAELSYVTDGHVQLLLAQDCYGWGYKSVETLLEKVTKNQSPPTPKIIDPLTEVTKETAADYAKNWDNWLGKK